MRRLAYGLLVLLLVLGLAEGLARALDLPDGLVHDPSGRAYRSHPTRFWVMKPDLDLEWRGGVRVRTNALGLRDDPVALPRPAGTRRVLSLGESTTFGDQVAVEDTYTRRLEALLPGTETVNAGVPGYTLWQSAVYLHEAGMALDPDVVLVYHQHNDFLAAGVVDPKSFLHRVPGTDREMYERRLRWEPALALAYRSRAFTALRSWLVRLPSPLPEVRRGPGAVNPTVRVPDADRRVALGWMARSCAPPDCRLVVLQPTYGQRMERPDDRLLADEARRLGVGFVDLAAARRASGLPDAEFFIDEVHPTPRGHAVLAEAIARALSAR